MADSVFCGAQPPAAWIGRTPASQAPEFLQEKGRKQVFFASYAPNYILPGIDQRLSRGRFLEAMGLQAVHAAVAMDRSWLVLSFPGRGRAEARREAEGYTFARH